MVLVGGRVSARSSHLPKEARSSRLVGGGRLAHNEPCVGRPLRRSSSRSRGGEASSVAARASAAILSLSARAPRLAVKVVGEQGSAAARRVAVPRRRPAAVRAKVARRSPVGVRSSRRARRAARMAASVSRVCACRTSPRSIAAAKRTAERWIGCVRRRGSACVRKKSRRSEARACSAPVSIAGSRRSARATIVSTASAVSPPVAGSANAATRRVEPGSACSSKRMQAASKSGRGSCVPRAGAAACRTGEAAASMRTATRKSARLPRTASGCVVPPRVPESANRVVPPGCATISRFWTTPVRP